MALQHLTEEQIQTWTREQKDRWWLENVYRGNMRQLTIRSAITGFMLGGVLSATNLYIGAKTGWTLGVGLTSVILAFAMFKALSAARMAKDFTILENNAMQSIATSAGYMTGPLISGLAAYMMVSDKLMSWHQMLLINVVFSILGVLVAFPMKRRFINEEQAPFPEGRACGVVLDTLYSSDANIGLFKAKALAIAAIIAGVLKFISGEGYQTFIQAKVLGRDSVHWMAEHLDAWYYKLVEAGKVSLPTIKGIDVRQLGLSPTLDLAMFGAGGLMNIKYATNLLAGMIVGWCILAPMAINEGWVKRTHPKQGQQVLITAPQAQRAGIPVTGGGVLAAPLTNVVQSKDGPVSGPKEIVPANTKVTAAFARTDVLNGWLLWPGVSMLVCASLTAFFAKPQVIISAFTGMMGKKKEGTDVLKHIEMPLWISFVGVPLVGIIGVWMMNSWFGVSWGHGLLAIPLIILLTLIAVNATALTSITPTGSISKITQFTFGVMNPKHPATNLMTATMTTEVASNAANLLMDIKPGYMLGAKPRQQAIGHCIGIFAGALASTPLFFLLFLAGHPDNPLTKPIPEVAGLSVQERLLYEDKFSFVAAIQWRGISDFINGLTGGGGLTRIIHPSALYAMLYAAIVGVLFEIVRVFSKGKFPFAPVAFGLGIVLPPDSTFWMFLGSLFFWTMGKIYRTRKEGFGKHLWVDTQEPICAGLIAGAALIGIGDILVGTFLV
jgi:uncharacterized oligopeptide transporter (OPT) family protein